MGTYNREAEIQELENEWATAARWRGVKRPYDAEQVLKLRGSFNVEHTIARMGAERLWTLMHNEPYVNSLGAVTGNQAVQMVQAGLKAIYLSGWQVAGDANTSGHTYPDQSLYPADSAAKLAKRINNSLMRADQIHSVQGKNGIHWMAPIVADAESGFGGTLNAFELVKALIEAGAGGIHLEDQLSSAKKCGHMGGKVLVPTREFCQKLTAARLAADVMGVPTVILARTDADSAQLLTSDIDPADEPFITGERTHEGFYRITGGIECAIARGLAYAEFADVVWCETSTPDIGEAREFAQAMHEKFPGKLLAYNCSPSFNWRMHLGEEEAARFQIELGELGYKYQFVTLAGFHALNSSMYELALGYKDEGMGAYSRLQEKEFEMEREHGFTAIKHQSFVGAGYFDEVQMTVTGGRASTGALAGSTEEAQFEPIPA